MSPDGVMTLPVKYTRTAIVLHWLIAVLIVANVLLGLSFDYVPDQRIRLVIDTHKSIGITVLGLAFMRLLWRATHPPPPLPLSYPRWERITAHLAHAVLYLLIFALPISGWMHDSAWKDAAAYPMKLFALVPWPRIGWIATIEPGTKEILHEVFGAVHRSFGYLLYLLFVLHVGGALKHQFRDKQPELQRMLP